MSSNNRFIHAIGCRKGERHYGECDPPEAMDCRIEHLHGGSEPCDTGTNSASWPAARSRPGRRSTQLIPVDCRTLKALMKSKLALQNAYIHIDDSKVMTVDGADLLEEISSAITELDSLRLSPVMDGDHG